MSYVQSSRLPGVIDFADMGFLGGDSRPEAATWERIILFKKIQLYFALFNTSSSYPIS